MHKKLMPFIVSLFLQACAVAVPTHQINSPQSLGNNVLEFAVLEGISPSVGPEFVEGTPPALAVANTVTDNALSSGYRLAYGLNDKVDLEIEALISIFSGATIITGLKYQWLGKSMYKGKAGDKNSSIRIRYISSSGFKDDPDEAAGNDTIFDDVFVEKMDATGYSAALSYGYLVADWFGVYLGGQAVTMNLEYRYREDNSTGTLYSDDRDITGFGPFVGFQMNTTGSFFRFAWMNELSYTNLPATYSDKKVWYEGFMSSLNLFFNFD